MPLRVNGGRGGRVSCLLMRPSFARVGASVLARTLCYSQMNIRKQRLIGRLVIGTSDNFISVRLLHNGGMTSIGSMKISAF